MNKNLFTKKSISNFSQKLLQSKTLLYFVIFLLIIKIFTVGIFINFPANIFFADITKAILTNLVNQEREALGLNTLAQNEKLDQAAYLKAYNMIQNDYFAHTSPTGVTPWFWFSQVGYNYKYAGENLAIGFFDSKTVYDAWLNSPAHKENLLNPNYKEIGTAVVQGFGENNAIVVVQLFGSLKYNQPIANNQIQKTNSSLDTTKTQNTEQEILSLETEQTTNEQTIVIKEDLNQNNQATDKALVLSASDNRASSDFYSKIMNYVLYSYEDILKNAIYGIYFIIVGLFLITILFNTDNLNKKFILRFVIIMALVSFTKILNIETIVLFIQPQIII
jgi:uncharacterized protein YkwD